MSVLSDFASEDQELVIRLPFRVGIWISEADQTGGDESSEQERQALNTIVASYAEDYLKSEFVQRVMELTLARKNEWNEWDKNVDAVPGECERAMQILMTRVSPRDVDALKRNLIDVGLAVAMAYREGVHEPPEDAGIIANFMYDLKSFFSVLFGGLKTRTADENISATEQKALIKLAGIMGLKTNVIAA